MNTVRTSPLQDSKVDRKVVLSGLWISTLFVFAYVDIFGFWRTDVIEGALAGQVPRTGFEIDQAFLTVTTLYIVVPSLMVVVSLLAPAPINRVANTVVSLVYVASVVATVIGETWTYYFLGSAVEVVLLLAIARIAWTWPRADQEWRRGDSNPLPPACKGGALPIELRPRGVRPRGVRPGQRAEGVLTACGPRVASCQRSASALPPARLRTATRAPAATAASTSFFSTRSTSSSRWCTGGHTGGPGRT